MSYNFPMIYCNGDSYSNSRYHAVLNEKTYAYKVGQHLEGFVIDKSINGSCNRRIIRTTISDLLIERKLNPEQKIIALLGLTFELRNELWKEQPEQTYPSEESNFRPHQFSNQSNWRENLLKGLDIDTFSDKSLETKFYKKFSEGRAFFFSPYAERINLLCDLIMLKSFLDSLDIKFLIFQSPKAEKLAGDFLLDQFKKELHDDLRFFDFENFGFCDWAYENKFIPLDMLDRPAIGHYGPDAHAEFAEKILLPRLRETGQI